MKRKLIDADNLIGVLEYNKLLNEEFGKSIVVSIDLIIDLIRNQPAVVVEPASDVLPVTKGRNKRGQYNYKENKKPR